MPPYDQVSLIPPTRKHTFAPEVDPAGLIDDEAEFEALSGIDWASSSFQDKAAGGEMEKDNPGLQVNPKSSLSGATCLCHCRKTIPHHSDSGSLVIE